MHLEMDGWMCVYKDVWKAEQLEKVERMDERMDEWMEDEIF